MMLNEVGRPTYYGWNHSLGRGSWTKSEKNRLSMLWTQSHGTGHQYLKLLPLWSSTKVDYSLEVGITSTAFSPRLFGSGYLSQQQKQIKMPTNCLQHSSIKKKKNGHMKSKETTNCDAWLKSRCLWVLQFSCVNPLNTATFIMITLDTSTLTFTCSFSLERC